MSQRKIELHVQTLDNILDLQQSDFSDFRSFNDYKKQQIKQFRNQLLSQHLGCDLS
jgi:4'-phosphopantetheinyl transferase